MCQDSFIPSSAGMYDETHTFPFSWRWNGEIRKEDKWWGGFDENKKNEEREDHVSCYCSGPEIYTWNGFFVFRILSFLDYKKIV
ncbi:hypothetical protein AVEN_91500-1 [Araneus ventricosus]|uniref:Uncharacterized protein n=1 Tax=Araneus ventricosus TaxID=182803 RepID=A0A4Y2BIQ6_ARAVE|nr:hypothetical protein AVEN_91500-1 [Araneus ventricosus]